MSSEGAKRFAKKYAIKVMGPINDYFRKVIGKYCKPIQVPSVKIEEMKSRTFGPPALVALGGQTPD